MHGLFVLTQLTLFLFESALLTAPAPHEHQMRISSVATGLLGLTPLMWKRRITPLFWPKTVNYPLMFLPFLTVFWFMVKCILMVIINSYILLLKLTFKVKNYVLLSSFFHTFWSEGNHQLFSTKSHTKRIKLWHFTQIYPHLEQFWEKVLFTLLIQ